MFEVLSGFDWLSDQFRSTEARTVVSVVAVAVLVVVILSYRSIEERLQSWLRPLYVDIIVTMLLVSTAVLTVAITVGVWGQTEEIQQLYADLGLGGEVIAKGIFTFTIIVISYIVTRFVRRLIIEVLDPSTTVTDHQKEITQRIAQILIWSISLVVVLGVWIEDLSGLLVGAGVLGIVLGMAARQTLSTILAGFVLMFARPFEIGDWIVVEDDEGIVTDISVFNTRIQSFDGEFVMVPNDLIASSTVTNRSKMGQLRIEIDVGVDYSTDLEEATDRALTAVSSLEDCLEVPEPGVITKSFGDSAIVLGVRFWIDRPSSRRRWNARTRAIHRINDEFTEAGITIPFPQRELSGRAETGGFRLADEKDRGTGEQYHEYEGNTMEPEAPDGDESV